MKIYYSVPFSMIRLATSCLFVLLLCVLVGCASVSHPRPEFAEIANPPDSKSVLALFRERVPKVFTERQTAVLDSKRGSMAAIGVCAFDKNKRRFALALITPTGMKLLQIENVDGKTTSRFYLPGVSPSAKAGQGVAEDAWRMYAHPDSPPTTREIRGNRIVFTWKNGLEEEKLIFGRSVDSKILDLKTKIISAYGVVECVIHYFNYRDMPDGTRRSELITYENKRFDYYLTIKRLVGKSVSR